MSVNKFRIPAILCALASVGLSGCDRFDSASVGDDLPYAAHIEGRPCTADVKCEYLGLFREIESAPGERLTLLARGPDKSCVMVIASREDADWYNSYWELAFEDGEYMSVEAELLTSDAADRERLKGLCEGTLIKLASTMLNSAIVVPDERP